MGRTIWCGNYVDGKIVGRGINYVKSRHDPTAHAEIVQFEMPEK